MESGSRHRIKASSCRIYGCEGQSAIAERDKPLSCPRERASVAVNELGPDAAFCLFQNEKSPQEAKGSLLNVDRRSPSLRLVPVVHFPSDVISLVSVTFLNFAF